MYKSRKLKNVISFFVLVLIVCSLVFCFTKINKLDRTTEVSQSFIGYDIGSLNSTGVFVENKTGIVTKNYLSTKDLKIEIVDNPTVTYDVSFYTEDKTFISKTVLLNVDFVAEVPSLAKYCKVSIVSSTDSEIGFTEINNIAKQLKISCSKE